MSAVSMADKEHVLTEKDVLLQRGAAEEQPMISGFQKDDSTLSEYLETVERTVIAGYLMENGGNISKTAKDLGMLRQNLQHKIKKYGL